jgi:peptide deformylase
MEILNYPHPFLKFKTRPLVKVDQSIREVAAAMIDLMRSAGGMGLSANQVGLPFRMFVAEWEGSELCFVNPEVQAYGKSEVKSEGCLSFPGLALKVRRRTRCNFKAYDLVGNEINEEATGPLARLLQHEMDHLDGRLFIDRVDMSMQPKQVATELALWERSFMDNQPELPTTEFKELLGAYC